MLTFIFVIFLKNRLILECLFVIQIKKKKFDVEFLQTDHQIASDGRWTKKLRYDYDVTSELWFHKSEQNCLCLGSGNTKQM